MADSTSNIRVKFLCRAQPDIWANLFFPGGNPTWARCDFIFDREAREYDWLVVYEDLPATGTERRPMREELLACPRQNTILLTTEPPSIKVYGKGLTSQYGCILTSQPQWALPHPNRIFRSQAMHRFYGLDLHATGANLTFDQIAANPPLAKSADLSTVCSAKQQKHTLHNQRFQFTNELKKLLPEMEIFGHGVRPMANKAEALDDYRYHLTIENYIGEHHFTEKLTDAFLGATLPFYCGCPNAADYFPEDSFIPLDINNIADSAEIIQRSIRNNEYEKRLPAILEARQRSLYRYNMFAIIAEEIEKRHVVGMKSTKTETICSRWLYLKKHPLRALQFAWERRRIGAL